MDCVSRLIKQIGQCGAILVAHPSKQYHSRGAACSNVVPNKMDKFSVCLRPLRKPTLNGLCTSRCHSRRKLAASARISRSGCFLNRVFVLKSCSWLKVFSAANGLECIRACLSAKICRFWRPLIAVSDTRTDVFPPQGPKLHHTSTVPQLHYDAIDANIIPVVFLFHGTRRGNYVPATTTRSATKHLLSTAIATDATATKETPPPLAHARYHRGYTRAPGYSTPPPTLTFEQFKASAKVSTVENLDKNGNAAKGANVFFTCTISSFVKDDSGNTAGANVRGTDTSSFTFIQIGFPANTDITKLNTGDTLQVWGTDQGVFSGQNALGGTVQEVEVTAAYMTDVTTGYGAP